MVKPFKQGDLDGLCGLYAGINAAKLLTRIGRTTGTNLLLDAVLTLEKNNCLSTYVTEGTTSLDLARILRDTICPAFHIKRSKPFHKKKNTSLSEFWQDLTVFLSTDKPRTAIISIEDAIYSHWTVVESINDKRIYLFDSYQRKVLNRNSCTTTELSATTPILIHTSLTYFLEKK